MAVQEASTAPNRREPAPGTWTSGWQSCSGKQPRVGFGLIPTEWSTDGQVVPCDRAQDVWAVPATRGREHPARHSLGVGEVDERRLYAREGSSSGGDAQAARSPAGDAI